MEEPEKRKKAPIRKTTRVLIVLLTIYALIALVIGVALGDARHVRFYMAGEQEMTVEYGSDFQDPGCWAVSTGRLFGESGSRLNIVSAGSVDTQTLGDYTIRYMTRLFLLPHRTERLVHVVDTTPPQIELVRREGYEPSWFTGYEEEGYSAWDAYDGDLSAQVQCREEPGLIEYSVTDSSGNTASVIRRLPYTLGVPVITLTGGEVLELPASLSYSDPGCTVTDDQGHDMSEYLRVEGQVIPWQVGEYPVRYSIENGRGDVVEAIRTVRIVPVRNPDTVEPDAPTIYLTFDDGPGPYTARLLDVLKAYNVKASFFVTCRYPDYFDMVGRAYAEGHTIGAHSASHNYYEIYASEDAYFDDFERVQDLIREQTGGTTKLFRFPGGSSNTVSRFNPGIMTRLTSVMEDMGYVYFDWNVSSGDAGETTVTDQVVRNVIEGCSERRVSVVLQHDVKDYSVAAVERIIVWALNNGYTFAALDETSPTAHHGLAN